MSISGLSSTELLQACVNTGAKEAWSEFIARYQPLIAGVIVRIVRRHRGQHDSALIDDLVQETYLRLCRNGCRVLRDFRPEHEGSFFGYLKNVAASVARDHFRAVATLRRGPETEPLDEITERRAAIPAQQEILERAELWRCLGLVTQSNRDKTVFKLHMQGFTAKEIATIPAIQLSEKGVESCLYRLIARMKRILNSSSPSKGNSASGSLGELR